MFESTSISEKFRMVVKHVFWLSSQRSINPTDFKEDDINTIQLHYYSHLSHHPEHSPTV